MNFDLPTQNPKIGLVSPNLQSFTFEFETETTNIEGDIDVRIKETENGLNTEKIIIKAKITNEEGVFF